MHKGSKKLSDLKVKVSGDLCHRSGYIQNDSVKNLRFDKSVSRMIQLTPGAYSLTVFVGASFDKINVDYSVELVTDPETQLHVPGDHPIGAKTVGLTGFVVINFKLS